MQVVTVSASKEIPVRASKALFFPWTLEPLPPEVHGEHPRTEHGKEAAKAQQLWSGTVWLL